MHGSTHSLVFLPHRDNRHKQLKLVRVLQTFLSGCYWLSAV